MPDLLTKEYAAPSYMLVLDSNLTIYQNWSNYQEVAAGGYSSLVKNTGKLTTWALGNSSTFPVTGNFYCSKNGHLNVRLTALKFDAPDGNYTYFIGTGQHRRLVGAFEDSLLYLMGSDLTKFYLISLSVYITSYFLALFLIECVVNKRIVSPVVDLTIKMRKPKEMERTTSYTRTTQSSGHLSGHSLHHLENPNQSSTS